MDAKRIAIVGVCAGAGYALKAATFDPRIRVFAGVAGFYPSPALMRSMLGAQEYQAALAQAIAVYERFGGVKEIMWLPADTHIGYYDDPNYLDPTLAEVTRFLLEQLGP